MDSAKNLSHNTENLPFNTLTSCSGRSFAACVGYQSALRSFISSSSAIDSSITSLELRLDLIAASLLFDVDVYGCASFDLSADWLSVYAMYPHFFSLELALITLLCSDANIITDSFQAYECSACSDLRMSRMQREF
jgi:hypothetical protein